MRDEKSKNYLRRSRRCHHFTQDDIAFLLGGECGTKIGRYERDCRLPPLETALALEAILGVPVRELFVGRFQKVEKEVRQRALVLLALREGERSENSLKRLAA